MSALRRFLPDFDAAVPQAQRSPFPVLAPFGFDVDPDEIAFAPEELTADPVAEAVAEAVATALAEAEAAHAAAIDDLSAQHTAALAEARAAWVAAEAVALADGFRAAVATLGDALGEAAAAALQPLLGDAARTLAVEGLRVAVADLVLAGTGGAVAVSGPADLLAALRAALDAAGTGTDAMDFTETEAAEVVVTADNSRIETRLAAWAGALGRRGAGAARPADTTGEDAR